MKFTEVKFQGFRSLHKKKTKKTSEMKILTKVYQQNLDFWTVSIEIDISEHGTFYFDSVEKKARAIQWSSGPSCYICRNKKRSDQYLHQNFVSQVVTYLPFT